MGMSGMGMGAGSGISLSGTALELKVVKPQHFESVPQIADHLLNKRTVVLNLEDTNKETARRLIDFLSGVAYSIDGSLKKIASNAYVITPSNVDVGDAMLKDRRAKAEAAQDAPAPAEEGAGDASDLFNF
ncbi:MAG: cell division protein SepF [Clostridia bacterium]|nr:cell division protein SepF [Clostridia bacterium]